MLDRGSRPARSGRGRRAHRQPQPGPRRHHPPGGVDTGLRFQLTAYEERDDDGGSLRSLEIGTLDDPSAGDLPTVVALRQGEPDGPGALHVFIAPYLSSPNLVAAGVATPPGRGPALLDGVYLSSLIAAVPPPSGLPTMTLERPLPHEVGHWLDLEHPWGDAAQADAGCDPPGDGVDDTPPMRPLTASELGTCPAARRSCGALEASDNSMNYPGGCATGFRFTAGQAARMRAAWSRRGSQVF